MDEPMRIDKWLWVARLSKTRALAAEAVKSGRVQINGVAAKPSKDVKPGDPLELRTGPRRRGGEVGGRQDHRRRGEAEQGRRARGPPRAAHGPGPGRRRDPGPGAEARHGRRGAAVLRGGRGGGRGPAAPRRGVPPRAAG